jgi:hypothetical protein
MLSHVTTRSCNLLLPCCCDESWFLFAQTSGVSSTGPLRDASARCFSYRFSCSSFSLIACSHCSFVNILETGSQGVNVYARPKKAALSAVTRANTACGWLVSVKTCTVCCTNSRAISVSVSTRTVPPTSLRAISASSEIAWGVASPATTMARILSRPRHCVSKDSRWSLTNWRSRS